MTLPEFILLRPLWLLGLPLAPVAAALVARRADGMAEWRAVVDPDLLEAMRLRGHVTPPRTGPDPWLMALALALLCAGLAGPASRDHHAPLLRNRDALMILFDLSPSMIRGGGLDDAQAAVSRLIDIGATRPAELARLRGLMPRAVLLIPGVGAQGGRVEDCAAAFDGRGLGGLVNQSRGILQCFEPDANDWRDRVGAAARSFAADLRRVAVASVRGGTISP